MARDSGPESGAKGVFEDVKGKAKEVAGEITGDESKEREGRAQQDKAQAHYDAIDALPTPPEELKQDFVSLRPTLNEFVALSGRTIEWLEGTEPAKPTDTPSEQLQALLDSPFLPKPGQITACP